LSLIKLWTVYLELLRASLRTITYDPFEIRHPASFLSLNLSLLIGLLFDYFFHILNSGFLPSHLGSACFLWARRRLNVAGYFWTFHLVVLHYKFIAFAVNLGYHLVLLFDSLRHLLMAAASFRRSSSHHRTQTVHYAGIVHEFLLLLVVCSCLIIRMVGAWNHCSFVVYIHLVNYYLRLLGSSCNILFPLGTFRSSPTPSCISKVFVNAIVSPFLNREAAWLGQLFWKLHWESNNNVIAKLVVLALHSSLLGYCTFVLNTILKRLDLSSQCAYLFLLSLGELLRPHRVRLVAGWNFLERVLIGGWTSLDFFGCFHLGVSLWQSISDSLVPICWTTKMKHVMDLLGEFLALLWCCYVSVVFEG